MASRPLPQRGEAKRPAGRGYGPSTDDAARGLVSTAQLCGDALAVGGGELGAREIQEVDADSLTGLNDPRAASRMVGKAQALVGAGADIDHAEVRRPGLTALGDDGVDDRRLVRPDLRRIDGE